MKTFKEFLNEATVNNEFPVFDWVNITDAAKLIHEKCKDAAWMMESGGPIWRGFNKVSNHMSDVAIVDPSKTTRRSENTSNFYTLIFDNIPSMKGWPKRSRSFIGSMSEIRAGNYGSSGDNLIAIVPFDGTKIGCVNHSDMWETNIKVFGYREEIKVFNNKFGHFGLSETDWSDWEKFQDKIKDEPELQRRMAIAFETTEDKTLNFLKEINRAYSPKSTGFSNVTTSTMKHNQMGEVWVGGNCVAIRAGLWGKVRKDWQELK